MTPDTTFAAFHTISPISAWPQGEVRGHGGTVQPLVTAVDTIVEFYFYNESPVNVDETFSVQVYFDGQLFDLREFEFYDLNYGGANGWGLRVVVPAGTVDSGIHSITMAIDPFNEIEESDETDNVYTRAFEWVEERPPSGPLISYTDDQLRSMLEPLFSGMLDEYRTVDELAEEGHNWLPIIQDAADAAYYLVTGRSFRDDQLYLVMAPYSEYVNQHATECMGQFVGKRLEDFQYLSESRVCAKPVGWRSFAYATEFYDFTAIIMHTRSHPGDLLLTLIHELGHAHQTLEYPLLIFGDLPFRYSAAIHEAQAQTFEAVALRRIEKFLDVSFGSYTNNFNNDHPLAIDIEYVSSQAEERQEHGLGYVLMWLNALEDLAGLGLREELEANGRLSWQTSYEVFKFFAGMDENELWAWIDEMLAKISDVGERYSEVVRARLVHGLPADKQAPAVFFRQIMLAP